MREKDIVKKLIDNDALFKNIYVIKQKFDILPNEKEHYGVSIDYQDIQELRDDFLNDLVDTIILWVYSSEKYEELTELEMKKKPKEIAHSTVVRKAKQKFRKGTDDNILVQGQFGELLLFHLIQRFMHATPLLRKMNITTSSQHERFGADAIHFKVEEDKNIIVLGEAKTYSSKYRFNAAFEDALSSILNTYKTHREELNLYVHEEFLDSEMDAIAEAYLDKSLENVEIHLVSIVIYNETKKIKLESEKEIREQIKKIIEEKYKNFDNNKIDIDNNPILGRITYIVFSIWKLDELLKEFQKQL